VVARDDVSHAGAHRLDDSRPLVPQNHREGDRVLLVAAVRVGLAYADGGNPDQHLVSAGALQAHRPAPERAAFLLDDRRLYIACRVWHGIVTHFLFIEFAPEFINLTSIATLITCGQLSSSCYSRD
jgi:hypothetical protein